MKKSLLWIKKRTGLIWSHCEGFLERCPDTMGGIYNPVYDLMYSASFEDSIHIAKGLIKKKGKNSELIAEDITDNLREAFIMTFGLGFVIGGTVELTDSEGQKAVEELREELKKFKIFPYYLREKAAHLHKTLSNRV